MSFNKNKWCVINGKQKMGSQKTTKKLRLFDIVLFNVCGILSVDTIAAGASMGVQGMAWRILGILFFFVPYGLATAELGSSWPKAGGIYVWTREAFGKIGLWITVFCGEFFILIAVFFFFIPPKGTVNVLRYELSLCVGVFVTLAVGLLIHFKTKRVSSRSTLSS